MDILTVMADAKHILSAIDECQLNTDNLGHEWFTRACDCQICRGDSGQISHFSDYLPLQVNYHSGISPKVRVIRAIT